MQVWEHFRTLSFIMLCSSSFQSTSLYSTADKIIMYDQVKSVTVLNCNANRFYRYTVGVAVSHVFANFELS